MFRSSARDAAVRLLVVLPFLVLAGCGGDDSGAVVTVPNSVVVSDFNGDGFLDVAVASAQIDETGLTQKPGLLQVILNTPATPGVFMAGVNYATSSAPPSGMAVGDLRGNGSHDIVVSNFNAGTLSVFMETTPTSGAYATPTTVTVGGNPNDVQIADLNGDGLPDLIVADNAGQVTYLLQNAASPGTFLPGVSLPVTNRGISVAVGDLNGDGLPDIAVTSFDVYGNSGLVTIYFQDPANPGTFLPTPTTITALGEPSQIRIADMNQDHAQDIVIACQGLGSNSATNTLATDPVSVAEAASGAMVILQNSGAPGTFATPVVYPTYVGAIGVAVGDLNLDGLPDIVTTGMYPQGTGTVYVLLQDPTAPGTFVASSSPSYPGDGQPVSIAIGDVDHDGLPDLVTADAVSAIWYKNQASAVGTFVPQAPIGY